MGDYCGSTGRATIRRYTLTDPTARSSFRFTICVSGGAQRRFTARLLSLSLQWRLNQSNSSLSVANVRERMR